MSLGPVIDVAIGLIFVYLLLGLATTAFQEILANALTLRGKMLRNTIADLLSSDSGPSDLFKRVFGHALISGTASNDYPSYVPSRNFALALIDTLNDGSNAPIFSQVETQLGCLPDGNIKETLRVFVQHASGDLDALKASLATWYDDAMDRLSGVYKRKSQWVAIACGIFFAVALNIDSIRIAQALWQNDALRGKVVAEAQAYSDHAAKSPPGTKSASTAKSEAALGQDIDALHELALPIGWDWKNINVAPSTSDNPLGQAWDAVSGYFARLKLGGTLLVLLGWAMTALATSLGAPFWFGTLQSFLQLRSTGPKPPRADAASRG